MATNNTPELRWTIAGTFFENKETGEIVTVPKDMTPEECLALLLKGERP